MKQIIGITVLGPQGGSVQVTLAADVVGGLAIHEAVRGIQLDDTTHTLTHVGSGLALCDGTPPVLRKVRTALLALDVPWRGTRTAKALWRYRLAIMDTMKAAKGAGA